MQEASLMGDNIESPCDHADNDKATSGISVVSSRKKRPYKAVSDVWEHFLKRKAGDGGKVTHCVCKYCKKEMACNSAQGTSSLWRHVQKCPKCPSNHDPKQALLSFNSSESHALKNWKFDQDFVRKRVAEMIIMHELPFTFVEHRGFRNVMMAAQPKYQFVSRTTVTKDSQGIYMVESSKLKEELMNCSRLCLTTDLWTSIQNIGYMCLTVHYIDKEWKLQKRIINFRSLPSPHTGEAIGHAIELCLLEWGIDKICTITVDNASANDVAVKCLKRKLVKKGGLLLDGELFHMRCAAHILNLIVKDGIDEVKDSCSRIRNCVKYVRSSPSRLQSFKKCIEEERITSKKFVCLDVSTRWNSTYFMLESALPFQKAFELLEEQDMYFKYELKEGPPTEDDWIVAKFLCQFLKTFYEATKQLSGSKYVTANIYFHQVIGMEHMLRTWICSSDNYFSEMGKKMKQKFDKYFGSIDKINMLLIIAVVLDPCYKLDYVGFWFKKLVGEEQGNENLKNVRSLLMRLFQQYKDLDPIPKPPCDAPGTCNNIVNANTFDLASLARQTYMLEMQETIQTLGKTELESYLEEKVEQTVDGFDILGWWKLNSPKYRVLSLMARDILAMPVSTVASESAFSAGGRVLDQYRSLLSPKMVECLICTQDWLRVADDPSKVDIAELIEELANLGVADPTPASTSTPTYDPISVD